MYYDAEFQRILFVFLKILFVYFSHLLQALLLAIKRKIFRRAFPDGISEILSYDLSTASMLEFPLFGRGINITLFRSMGHRR